MKKLASEILQEKTAKLETDLIALVGSVEFPGIRGLVINSASLSGGNCADARTYLFGLQVAYRILLHQKQRLTAKNPLHLLP